MMPIEPEPPAEPSAESGELEGLALRTVLLSEEQTPDHRAAPEQTDRQRTEQRGTDRHKSIEKRAVHTRRLTLSLLNSPSLRKPRPLPPASGFRPRYRSVVGAPHARAASSICWNAYSQCCIESVSDTAENSFVMWQACPRFPRAPPGSV